MCYISYALCAVYAYSDKAEVPEDMPAFMKERVASAVADAVISLTALAVGILGLVGILPGLPPAASYTLIGVSGLITLEWVALAAYTKGGVFRHAASGFEHVCGGSED